MTSYLSSDLILMYVIRGGKCPIKHAVQGPRHSTEASDTSILVPSIVGHEGEIICSFLPMPSFYFAATVP